MTQVRPYYVTAWMWACPQTVLGRWLSVEHGTLRRRPGWYVRYLFQHQGGGSYHYRGAVPDEGSDEWVRQVVDGLLAKGFQVTLHPPVSTGGPVPVAGAFVCYLLDRFQIVTVGTGATLSEALVSVCMAMAGSKT